MLKKIYQNLSHSFIFFVIAASLNLLGSDFIAWFFPNRPIVTDLGFALIPEVSWTQYLSDPILILSFLVFLYFFLKKLSKKQRESLLPKIFFVLGAEHFLRAIMIILTPMARPGLAAEAYGIFKNMVTQLGMFPSGHTAAALVTYYFARDYLRLGKAWNSYFFWSFIGQMVVLLFSRGHYSVDIAGGIMIAYIAYRVMKDFEAELD